ncbi:NAD(P)-dependent oxidoreductase [Candidatus Stoquefichus sp. SB1]|uniref:NAD(P)-dependent oxidoreductase n=1 Tax=Candidatus Stoquefichus sp. SB1 TaxID=1658109 RepID=UPI00067ED45A|nr:NAD(P)-dependent oxidoreductase [Candidatus Stoquefichus sp. SB1]
MQKIGFIGVGVMGKSMVRNLQKAGYSVTIYTRTKEKVIDLIDEGIFWKDNVKECVKNQDVIMTMVGYPHDVEDVYYGQDGIIQNAKKGALLIDFTTSSPALAQRIYADAKSAGLNSLDAPVSGGDIGAQKATLSIMVGGDLNAFHQAKALFESIGQSIHHVGEAGMGQHTKMANQIVIAGTIASVVEAIHYAHTMNLDTNIMMQCISHGAAASWQLEHNGQAIIEENFEPGFYIKHFIKDMKIAQKEMSIHSTHLQVLDQVLKMYENLNENDKGTQALIHYYEKE